MVFYNPPTRRRADALDIGDIVHIRNGVDEVHLGGTYFSGVPRWRITDISATNYGGPPYQGDPFVWFLVRVGDRKQAEYQFTPGTRGVYVAETVKKANPTVSRVSTYKATTRSTHHDHAHKEWKWLPPRDGFAGEYIL